VFDVIVITSYLAHGQPYYALGTLVAFLWKLDPCEVRCQLFIEASIGRGIPTEELRRYYSDGVVPASVTGYLAFVSVLATPVGSLSVTTMLLRLVIAGFALFVTLPKALEDECILARGEDVDLDDFYSCERAKVNVKIEDTFFLPLALLGMPVMCSRLDVTSLCGILFWFLACRIPFRHLLICFGSSSYAEQSVFEVAGIIKVSFRVLYFALAYALSLSHSQQMGELAVPCIGAVCILALLWVLKCVASLVPYEPSVQHGLHQTWWHGLLRHGPMPSVNRQMSEYFVVP